MKVRDYLLDPEVRPRNPSSRLRSWAHDNCCLVTLVTVWSVVQMIVTVITCHH